MFRSRGIKRIGDSVAFALAKVIYQQIAGDGGYPGHERALGRIVGIQRSVHLDKDLLGKVLSVLSIPGKPVADVIDPPVIALDDLFPSRSVARNAATDQQSDNLGFIQSTTPRTA